MFRSDQADAISKAAEVAPRGLRYAVTYSAPTNSNPEENQDKSVGIAGYVFWQDEQGQGGVVADRSPDRPCTGEAILDNAIAEWSATQPGANLSSGVLPDFSKAEADGSFVRYLLRGSEEINQERLVAAQDRWLALPVSKRVLHFDDPAVPSSVLARFRPRGLLVRVPPHWLSFDVTLCSRTSLGWGPVCYPLSADRVSVSDEFENVFAVEAAQVDSEPIELVLVRNMGIVPSGEPSDQLSLGMVRPTEDSTAPTGVKVVGSGDEASSGEELFASLRDQEGRLVPTEDK